MPQNIKPAAFITFYSFKGGVGRSMALINTGGILAGRRGFRVLVIDLDLEAPGLSYLGNNSPNMSSGSSDELLLQSGFVDLMADAKERGAEGDLFVLAPEDIARKYTQQYWFPDELRQFKDGSLHIMPAGRFDGRYAARFDALNLPELYRRGIGEPLIRAFKKKLAESELYDYVLVDSRTGFSDEAGICTRDLADHLMIFSGLNRQNLEGTSEFLSALRAATSGNKTFQVILSPVPTGEDKLFEERESEAKRLFEQAWKGEVDLSLQIPYHPQLALTEEPHIFRRRRGPLVEAYRAIERRMLLAIGHDAMTAQARVSAFLSRRDFPRARRELDHLIRLDGAKSAVGRMVESLVWRRAVVRGRKAERDAAQKDITLDELLATDDGVGVIELLVSNLPAEGTGWVARELQRRLDKKAPDLARKLLTRIVSSSNLSPDVISEYAEDLELRNELDAAESLYRRGIDVSPGHAQLLRDYARFLQVQRNDFATAELFYQRSIEAEPNLPHSKGDYGQLLVAAGRLSEAEPQLIAALRGLAPTDYPNLAEVCYSLWLLNKMRGSDASLWESSFKFLLERKFPRHKWSFDQMLRRAEAALSPADFQYAQALARAFLSGRRVRSLNKYGHWVEVVPRDPKISSDQVG